MFFSYQGREEIQNVFDIIKIDPFARKMESEKSYCATVMGGMSRGDAGREVK
jgi:hypothetical protein